VLGLFNYRKFLFQRLKVLIARIFQVVKSFRFTNVEGVRNLIRVISRNSARVQNYSNCLSVFEINLKCFPSSKFEPHSFAKCLQNLLIENQWKDFDDFLRDGLR
jgi:hypothetical protein